jgi:membrane peptidoglycan carboxypeptidase
VDSEGPFATPDDQRRDQDERDEHSPSQRDPMAASDGTTEDLAQSNVDWDSDVDETPFIPVDLGEVAAWEDSLAEGGSGRLPLATSAAARRAAARQHINRRRRRFIFYVRRITRTRQAARSVTIARAAWVTVVVLAVLVVTALTATFGLAASYYNSEATNIAALSHTVASRDSMRIYDSHGTLLYELKNAGAQHSIPLPQMPMDAINATVAIEDHTFWVNQGLDFASIARAALADFHSGGITQGASTITQQLIKQNILNSNENFDRKLREAILAFGMTTQKVYSKSQILQMYLNSIPYGQEAYGLDAAAQTYFGYQDDPATGETAAQHLDLAQASMLAGIPQNPNTNNPLLHFQHAHDRQKAVLDAMIANGYITQAQASAAYAEAGKPGFFTPQLQSQNLAPHFVTFVQNQIDSMIASGQLNPSRSGLNVYTTLDLGLQNQVQAAMKDHLYGDDTDDYTGNLIRNDNVSNSAAVLVQHSTGAIKVLLGSIDYNNTAIHGQDDVATLDYRSPGSSFKPIIYSLAFEKGWFPAMTLADDPTVFWDQGADAPYKVLDFNPGQFRNTVTIRQALQMSLNIPAVKAMQFVGTPDAQRQAARFGIHPEGTWGLSSVLGALDVHLIDMVQAYTVFANYGQYIPLRAIDRITDSFGNVLYQYHVSQPVQVISPQVAYMITSVLSDNAARTPEFGPCSPLYLDGLPIYKRGNPCQSSAFTPRPAAVKTGTAQNLTDDFTMGYTMDYTMGVWVGNSNNSPMINLDGVTGAAPIWYDGMMAAEGSSPKRAFPIPTGLRFAPYTSDGIQSRDWFLAGPLPPANIGNTEPGEPCVTLTNNPADPWVYCAGSQATPTPTIGIPLPPGFPFPPNG